MHEEIRKLIREVPDFPKKGILFRDITPALLDPRAFAKICDSLVQRYEGRSFDKIAGIESRGFFFSSVLAYRLGKGLIPMRKPGKLPWKTVSESYSLEYGEASLEMHSDAILEGEKILVIDDLLATGGTASAAAALVEKQGGIVEEMGFIIELSSLEGRKSLGSRPVYCMFSF